MASASSTMPVRREPVDHLAHAIDPPPALFGEKCQEAWPNARSMK